MNKVVVIIGLTMLFLVGCSSIYKDSMKQGKEALDAQKYEEAVMAFETALSEKPNDEEALAALELAKKEIEKIEKKKEEERKRKEQEEKEREERKRKEEERKKALENPPENLEEYIEWIVKYLTDLNESAIQEINIFDKGKVHVKIIARENLTANMTKYGAENNSLIMFEQVYNDRNDIKYIEFIWLATFIDEYGNEELNEFLGIGFEYEVLEKINWDNFYPENMKEVANYYWVHPSL